MTWVTLFASWQFWLAMTIATTFAGMIGFGLYSIIAINAVDDDKPLTFGEFSLEMDALREEARILRIENAALRQTLERINAEQDMIDEGCPNASELQPRLKRPVH